MVRWESLPRGSFSRTWKLSSRLFSRPDWLPLGLRGCLRYQRGAASLRYRNRAKITVLVCEQTPYQLWFSCRRKSCPVKCKRSLYITQKFAAVIDWLSNKSVGDASSDISPFFSLQQDHTKDTLWTHKREEVEGSIDRLPPKTRPLLREVARQTAFILAWWLYKRCSLWGRA